MSRTPYNVNPEVTGRVASKPLSQMNKLNQLLTDTIYLAVETRHDLGNKLSFLDAKLNNNINPENKRDRIKTTIEERVPIDFTETYTFDDIVNDINFLKKAIKSILTNEDNDDYLISLNKQIDLVAEKCKTSSITTAGSKYSKKRRVNRNKRISKRRR